MRVVSPPELDEGAVVAALVGEDPRPVVEAVVAEAPGIYAWWARPERLVDTTPPIPPVHPPGASEDWALLYVGIAPKRPSKTGVDRTIAARVSKDHRGGNIGGSTFRQSLAAVVREHLGLVAKSGHGRARLVDEKPLGLDRHELRADDRPHWKAVVHRGCSHPRATRAAQPAPWLPPVPLPRPGSARSAATRLRPLARGPRRERACAPAGRGVSAPPSATSSSLPRGSRPNELVEA